MTRRWTQPESTGEGGLWVGRSVTRPRIEDSPGKPPGEEEDGENYVVIMSF